MRLGRHVPMSPSPLKAIQRAQMLKCEAIQVFLSNPAGWRQPEDDFSKIAAFAQAIRENDFHPIVIHAPYLINLASSDDIIWNKSFQLLHWTLQRASLIGASSVVFHTGSHRGISQEAGIERIAEGINRLLAEKTKDVMLLLENGVGAGSTLGGKFEHLRDVLDRISEYQEQVGICLDTAHLWGAGYDLSTALSTLHVINHFNDLVGLSRLKVIHLNDTGVARNSHRDLHARIGEGIIPLESFQIFLNDVRLDHCTCLMETPVKTNSDGKEDWEHERQNIEQVKSLVTQLPAIFDGKEFSFTTAILKDKEETVQQLLW